MRGVSWLHKVEWKIPYILFSFSPYHFPVFWKGVNVTCFQLALSFVVRLTILRLLRGI
jgi:hypothetical protein